jgi:hypothetical protein
LDTAKELMGYFLPEGTLDYFELTHVVKDKEGLVLFLEEKNVPPAEYAGQALHQRILSRRPGAGLPDSPTQG